MKKLLSLVLAGVMLLSLCPSFALAEADTSKFVEINLLSPGNPPDDMTFLLHVQDTWNEYLKEKLNCSVIIDFLTWNDWETNYNLKLVSGDGLDIVDAGTWLDLWTNCKAGAYMDLSELLPVYAPNIYARLSEEEWEALKYDGQLLYIPQLWFSQWTDQGYAYRADWAEEVGITEPIASFAQLDEYLTRVQAAAGTGTIPADIRAFYTHNNRAENFYTYVTANTREMYLDLSTGFTFILSYNPETNTVSSPIFNDDVMYGFASMMKKWYDSKIYNTDVLNCTDDVEALFIAGKTALYGAHTESYTKGFTHNCYDQWEEDGNTTARVAYFSPCDQSGNLFTINPANDCIALSYQCSNPERALMFLDLYYSDPYLYRLMQYGIENENYLLDENGVRQEIPEEELEEGKDITFFTNMWGCRISEYDYPSANWDPQIEEINQHKLDIARLYPLAAFSFDSSDVSGEYAAVCEVVDQYMPLITYGIIDNVEETVQQFRSALQAAGIDDLIESVQEQVDASLEK